MVLIFTEFFYLCHILYKLTVLIASNLTEQCQNSKIILWGSTEFILNMYVVKHPRSHNLAVSKVHQNAGSESSPPEFYINLSIQPLEHCFLSFYNVGKPTPWVQHAALTSIAPPPTQWCWTRVTESSLGGSSWPGWRDQKGSKFTLWSLWGRLRAPGYGKGLSTAFMTL